jgi:hypothetical protein
LPQTQTKRLQLTIVHCTGTSFWYFLRGIVRVIDPATVCDWFRPPSQLAEPNGEFYTLHHELLPAFPRLLSMQKRFHIA